MAEVAAPQVESTSATVVTPAAGHTSMLDVVIVGPGPFTLMVIAALVLAIIVIILSTNRRAQKP